MADLLDLTVSVRDGVGKGAARATRRENQVPGIVYGNGEEPVAISVDFYVLLKMLRAGKFMSTLINLTIDGKDQRVICRGVQRHVVKDMPIHIDFLRLSRTSRISLNIPVNFVNEEECPGLKKGGVLTVVRNEVELKVTAGDIPESLTVDLTGYEVGDVIHMSNIELPKGARAMITDRDFVIANIAAPSSLKSAGEDETEESAEEATTEGEATAE
ncbi:MAG: 50S ribosomal protein L25/general stress protein Ctc [Rhodobacteraceae bacterium]|nr:50S ribosomal protein L25/general stress protein Ctc [Paracoccaceae bacterium]